MKPKAIILLVLFCFVLGFLAVDGLCTTDKRVSSGKYIRYVSEDHYPPEVMQIGSRSAKYALEDSGDCFTVLPDSGVEAPAEHDWVGHTYYEFQKNGAMGRMISVTSEGQRHVSWMWSGGVYPPGPRRVYARSKQWGAGAWSTLQEVGLGQLNSGYSNQTHLNDGTSVVYYHSTADIGGKDAEMAIADGPAANPLYTRKWDLPDALPQGSGEEGSWPKGDVLYVVDETVHPEALNYLHIVITESALAGGLPQWIGYMRCYIHPVQTTRLMCQTPTVATVYNIPANTELEPNLDIYGPDQSYDVSAVVATNRYGTANTGQRVAIAYLPMVEVGDANQMHDVGYIECMDNGDGWLDGTDWPPVIHRVTDYLGSLERAFHDVSACYDYQDSLHLAWTTAGVTDPNNPTGYYPGIARIYHWSKKTGVSSVASKIQEGAGVTAHCINVSKVTIAPKDSMYHPGGDSVYLYCTWVGVDSSDVSFAEFGNGDIYGSGSFDGGNTWGKVLNLTNTKAPGCVAGNCISEHWASQSVNMYNGDLHIEYICDRDAGAAIYDEGVWTRNHVMYMRLPQWEVTPGPRAEYRIDDPPHWYHPPIKVVPNQTRTIRFVVRSIGNESLIYSVTSDHPCIQVEVPPSSLAPKDTVVIPVLIDGTGACNGTFIAGNVILSTNDPALASEPLRVHAVVANEYYECPRDQETWDSVENSQIKMYLNANCMQTIEEIGMRPDTSFGVFFQGGTIVATTREGDTLVGRHMGENDIRSGAQDKLYMEQCEPDWEPHFWVLYTKEIYIEAAHLSPPSHMKWFWWEIAKQVKFFKDSAPEDYQRIVIKYVKVMRQDPPGWWPDLAPPPETHEETYIGFAMDLDCPYDTSGTDPPNMGDESACNYGAYDDVNEIVYCVGFGREHPEYATYHAGVALAEGGTGSPTTPLAVNNIKNNQYLYPTSPWGWIDQELYELAAGHVGTQPYVQDPDSILDRSVVVTANMIPSGTGPARSEYTLVEVLAPTGYDQMVQLVATARDIVATESTHGFPAVCGDATGDGIVNVGDVVYLVGYLYKSGPAPVCPQARGDVNADGIINVGDVVYVVGFLYKSGPEPKCPGIWYWAP